METSVGPAPREDSGSPVLSAPAASPPAPARSPGARPASPGPRPRSSARVLGPRSVSGSRRPQAGPGNTKTFSVKWKHGLPALGAHKYLQVQGFVVCLCVCMLLIVSVVQASAPGSPQPLDHEIDPGLTTRSFALNLKPRNFLLTTLVVSTVQIFI